MLSLLLIHVTFVISAGMKYFLTSLAKGSVFFSMHLKLTVFSYVILGISGDLDITEDCKDGKRFTLPIFNDAYDQVKK